MEEGEDFLRITVLIGQYARQLKALSRLGSYEGVFLNRQARGKKGGAGERLEQEKQNLKPAKEKVFHPPHARVNVGAP